MLKQIRFVLTALLLASTILSACAPQKADLIPSPPKFVNFCETNTDGSRLLVYVKNIGGADAASAEVQVEFFIAPGSSNIVNGITVTGVLAPNQITNPAIEVPIPAACFNPDCNFKITIDPSNVVPESNETNNTVDGSCLG